LLKRAKVEQTENLQEIFHLKKLVHQQKGANDKMKKRREQDKMIFVEVSKER